MTTEDLRTKTIDTALQMFNERGCKATTMDDIAQAMHISKRTLYEVFSTKEELLGECLAHIHQLTNEIHRHAHSQVDEPLLVAMYMLHTNALFVQRYQRIIEESERYYQEIHDRFYHLHSDKLRQLMTHGMEYARARGYLRTDANIEVAVDFLCHTIQQHRLSEMADSEAYTKWLNEVCFTYIRGLMSVDTIERYEQGRPRFRQVISEVNDIIANTR